MIPQGFRDVPGYEGLYAIGEDGAVWSIGRVSERRHPLGGTYKQEIGSRFLRAGKDADGYLTVRLYRSGERPESIRVHRLVALAFHGPQPTPQHQVAHGDGNIANNHFMNLRWATPPENNADQILHGTRGRGARNYRDDPKLTPAIVLEIRAAHGVSRRALARQYGVRDKTIAQIQNREFWAWV